MTLGLLKTSEKNQNKYFMAMLFIIWRAMLRCCYRNIISSREAPRSCQASTKKQPPLLSAGLRETCSETALRLGSPWTRQSSVWEWWKQKPASSNQLCFLLMFLAGTSTENDCAFEPDYAIPPLPVTEGMQHIRIMEGMSRSLPSSPLLTHQSISVRLQPVKKLTGKDFK